MISREREILLLFPSFVSKLNAEALEVLDGRFNKNILQVYFFIKKYEQVSSHHRDIIETVSKSLPYECHGRSGNRTKERLLWLLCHGRFESNQD